MGQTYYFCTYFDRNYLPRGLALYRSLQAHCPQFKLWVLCMDDETYAALTQLNLPAIVPVALRDLEQGDTPLLAAKQNRSRVEYYFTTTPSLLLYLFNRWPAVELVTYLDADLFFFASPAPLFEELSTGSIAIIAHRFPPRLRYREMFGIYNVGWLSFKRDESAFACLRWWREKCIDWCYDRVEEGRFADQKYLDEWPSRFEKVVVLEHKGANLAPWNLPNYQLRALEGNLVTVDEQPLIFFHFHALKQVGQWLYNPGWIEYGIDPSRVLRRRIYAPYLRTLFAIASQLASATGAPAASDNLRNQIARPRGLGARIAHLGSRLLSLPAVGRKLLAGKYVFVVNGHVV